MAYTTIDKPSDYFETKLYVGNESTNAITNLDFQPDMVWLKNRDTAYYHGLYDSVRGTGNTKALYPNAAEAEGQNAGNFNLASFNSDGFTLGATSSTNIINKSSQNHVSWNWKAGTTISSTSTTGSGTAKTYTGSVNTTAGFSIIRYVGNGTAGHTIPHHLGKKPDAILVKHLGDGQQWATQWSPLGATNVLRFATTNAVSDSNTRWNDTEPTSSVFTLGNEAEGNTNDGNHIAYCFTNIKGYSKFGSYIGNGSADGTFVYTGFKPAWTLIKRTDSSTGGSWILFDNKRGTNVINPVDVVMAASNDQSESDWGTTYDCDYLSNGFKWRMDGTGGYNNISGGTYIYMAFAEHPFVSSTGTPTTAR